MRALYLNGPYRGLAYSRASRSPAVTKSGTLYYPLWLASAAGLARQEGLEVSLVDAVARRWERGELIRFLQDGPPPQLVVLDTTTPSIDEDLLTAGTLKEAFPATTIALAGTHATACAQEVLGYEGVDVVLRGEYDRSAIELARALEAGKDLGEVTGLSFRRDGAVEHTQEGALIEDLDSLPFLSRTCRDFLRLEDYFFAAARYPMVMTITSRGCPHRCGWCLYPQVMHRGKYRTRSARNVADEFAFISQEMPRVREVGIEDDLFTGDRRRLRTICEMLIEQRNRVGFWCDTRVDLDYETMRLMKAAGCRLLIAGFESASQAVLDEIGKGTQAGQAGAFMANARKARLLVHGCFVVGNPGETRETMRETLEMAKRLNPDTAQFFPMIVYPGTRLYGWAKEKRYLRAKSYGDYLTAEGGHNSVVDLPGLPGGEVLAFCDHARREFYLRKGYVLRKMGQSVLSWSEAQRNFKAFRRFARHLVRAS